MVQYMYGISTFIVSIAILNWSITQSNAGISGPNISLGSNPIESAYGVQRMYPGDSISILTGASTMDFIVTRTEVSSTRCAFAIDGNTVFSHYSSATGYDVLPYFGNAFEGTLKVPAGSTFSMKTTITSGDVDCSYYMDGYYTQP